MTVVIGIAGLWALAAAYAAHITPMDDGTSGCGCWQERSRGYARRWCCGLTIDGSRSRAHAEEGASCTSYGGISGPTRRCPRYPSAEGRSDDHAAATHHRGDHLHPCQPSRQAR